MQQPAQHTLHISIENSDRFVVVAVDSADGARPSSHHQSTRTIRTSHVAAPGRCAHHPGITPEGVICGDRDNSPAGHGARDSVTRTPGCVRPGRRGSEVRCARGQSPLSSFFGGERSGPGGQ